MFGVRGQMFGVRGQMFGVRGQMFGVRGQMFGVRGQMFGVQTSDTPPRTTHFVCHWMAPRSVRDRPRPGCAETRENLHPPARCGRPVSPDSSPPPAGLLDTLLVECHVLRKRLIELPGHPYLEESHPLHRRDTEISLVIDLRLDDVTKKVNRAGLGA